MANKIVVPAVVLSKVKTYDFDNFTLGVSGDPSNGSRSARISVPILDGDGVRVDVATVEVRGDEFSAFWESYTSDKQLVELVMAAQGAECDTSPLDDSIVNTPQAEIAAAQEAKIRH